MATRRLTPDHERRPLALCPGCRQLVETSAGGLILSHRYAPQQGDRNECPGTGLTDDRREG